MALVWSRTYPTGSGEVSGYYLTTYGPQYTKRPYLASGYMISPYETPWVGGALSGGTAGVSPPASADYDVVVNAKFSTTSANDYLYIYLRATTGGSVYTAYGIKVSANGAWSITRFNAGTPTALTSGTGLGITLNTVEEFRGRVEGNIVSFYHKGGLIGSHDDGGSAITAIGQPGFAVGRYPSAAAGALALNFQLHTIDATALAWTGTIGTQNWYNGSAITPIDLSSYVSGGEEPYTFALYSSTAPGGLLPSGLYLDAQTGSLYGTPDTTGGPYDLVFSVTDNLSAVVYSNGGSAFAVTVNAAANQSPVFSGAIPTINGTINTALATYPAGTHFTDPEDDTLTFTKGGTWPTGVNLSSSTGAITGTPTESGTFATCYVTADDGISTATDSDTFSFVIAAASSNTASVTTTELHNGGTSKLTSTAVSWIWFPTDVPTSLAAGDWVTGTGTTSASGILTTTATLPAGAGQIFIYIAGATTHGYLQNRTAA